MDIEKQVCTLKQSKELDRLGLKLESYLVWIENADRNGYIIDDLPNLEYDLSIGLNPGEYYYAYSCAELGSVLPNKIKIHHSSYIKTIDYKYKLWSARYVYYSEYSNDTVSKYNCQNSYETHAKADMLIYLLKEKLIKVEDLTLEE